MYEPGRLEDDYREPFEAWQASPSPATAGHLLRKLKPVIQTGLRNYVGRDISPTLQGRAKQLTLDAIGTYDPHRAKLSTHVINNLQSLRRAARQERQVLSVPEGQSIDAGYLQSAQTVLEDRFGRSPSTQELSDYTGMSGRRIGRIRGLKSPMSEGSVSGPGTEPPAVQYDRSRLLMEAVYEGASANDQRVMEWTLGLHGQPKLTNAQIALKLGVTPGAVSQRKAKLQQHIDSLTMAKVI